MSVVTTTARIAAMCRLIEGIQSCDDTIPRTLVDALLPKMVIFPGTATFDRNSAGRKEGKERRLYRLALYLANAKYGVNGQVQDAIEPFFDRVRDYFLARPGLELDTATNPQIVVYEAVLEGDGGLDIQPYPLPSAPQDTTNYICIFWNLYVTELFEICYQD